MDYKIDLHVHTNLSDGLYSPSEVFNIASREGIKKLVITDHNCVFDNYDEIILIAKEYGIDIPFHGVEFNCYYDFRDNGERFKLHVLLYSSNLQNSELLNKLQIYNDFQNNHIMKQINVVNKILNLDLKEEELFTNSDVNFSDKYMKKLYCRSNPAEIISKHIQLDINEIKEKYFPKIKSEIKYKNALNLLDVIKWVDTMGGVLIIAHPGWVRTFSNRDIPIKQLMNVYKSIIDEGIDGFEVHHRLNSSEFIREISLLCEKYKLIATGGSDFHGKPRCKIGSHICDKKNYFRLLKRLK